MCGIAGIFHQIGDAPIDKALLVRMTSRLYHRGPDGDGFHVEPSVGLGHRRLSIVDIDGGSQPMFNEDGSVSIVFNGEIYDYAAIRAKLQAAGHIFRTRSDTEVIIHAWESWGPDCLQHLPGMFALALWDRNRQTLFLARDRLGKKPLYYAWQDDGTFLFASEMQALAAAPELRRQICPRAVEDFFTYGYVPDPATIYEGIHKLPAAHYLLLQRNQERVRPQAWWHLRPVSQHVGAGISEQVLLDRLSQAVADRLIADVPLGAFLSGGVDSSSVVALAAERQGGPLTTFAIGFPGVQDERPYAQIVAQRYGTDHHAEAGAVDYIDAARSQADVFGEPFGDHSSVPTFSVCALARRHATVALSGDGGDEVLAGYRRYRWHALADAVRSQVPAGLRQSVLGPLARLYPKLDRAPRWMRAKYTLTELSLDSAAGYARTVTKLHEDRRRALFSGSLLSEIEGHDPLAMIQELMVESGSDDPLQQAQYVDLKTYLVGDILTKVDRASMANSLEVRSPFLDHGFVQWGLSLPADRKLQKGTGKLLLKQAMESRLPKEILYRTKQGFAMPLAEQFRQQSARLRSRLTGPTMLDSGFFRREAIWQLIDEHASRQSDHSLPLWLLLTFEGFLAWHSRGTSARGSADAAAYV